MARSKPPATYDDLLKLPDNLIGEIIDGELVASPRPRPLHSHTMLGVASDISGPFDRSKGGPGGWFFLIEPELHLHGDVIVPDVAGWRRDRMTNKPDPEKVGIELPPDWACEVLSPSTARYDRNGKMKIYAREKVGHVWLLDPANRTLEVFVPGDAGFSSPPQVFGGDDRVRAEPFAAVELELSRWWWD